MSLDKFKKGSSEQLNLLKSKLFTVDTHIRRSENLPATLFMHPELIEFLTRPQEILQTTKEMALRKSKSYLFFETPVIKFFFVSLPLPEDRRFILKIQPSKTQLEVLVSLDGQRKVGYIVKDSKGILINETGWKKAEFTLIAKKKDRLSTAKVELDTIMIDHKTKIFGMASQKKQIQKQLKDYLKNNLTKEKIAEIMEKRRKKSFASRSLKRAQTFSAQSNAKSIEDHQTSRMYRSISGFNESTSIIKNRSPIYREPRMQSTQIKRELQQFEESKKKYLKHINKMEPEIADELMQNKNKYLVEKQRTLQGISTIVSSISFMRKFLKICRIVSKEKCRRTQGTLLCKKFYKNLVHANKMRMTFRTRNKLAMDLNLGMISCCLWEESRRKAGEKIVDKIKTELFKLDIQNVLMKSFEYHQSALVIQKKFRSDNNFYRLRFETMTLKKSIKFANEQQLEEVFKQYKQLCYSKSKKLKYGFTKFHKLIDDIMRQKALKQIRF